MGGPGLTAGRATRRGAATATATLSVRLADRGMGKPLPLCWLAGGNVAAFRCGGGTAVTIRAGSQRRTGAAKGEVPPISRGYFCHGVTAMLPLSWPVITALPFGKKTMQ